MRITPALSKPRNNGPNGGSAYQGRTKKAGGADLTYEDWLIG